MTMYRDPTIDAPSGISQGVVDQRAQKALQVFLNTPNITQGPAVPPPMPAMAQPLQPGRSATPASVGAPMGGFRKKKRFMPPAPAPDAYGMGRFTGGFVAPGVQRFDDGGDISTDDDKARLGTMFGGAAVNEWADQQAQTQPDRLKYSVGEQLQNPVFGTPVYGSSPTNFQPPVQNPITQVLAADKLMSGMGLPEASNFVTGYQKGAPDANHASAEFDPITGRAALTGSRSMPAPPAAALHESLHGFETGLSPEEYGKLQAIIAANPIPMGIPEAHHPSEATLRSVGLISGGGGGAIPLSQPGTFRNGGAPTGITNYFDYLNGYPIIEGGKYLPPDMNGKGVYGRDVRLEGGQQVVGQARPGIPLDIQGFLREYGPIVGQRYAEERQRLTGFADGGDISTDSGESDDDRKLREAIAAQQANEGNFAASQQTFLGTPVDAPLPQQVNLTPPNPQAGQIAAGEAGASDYAGTLAQLRDYMVGGEKGPTYGPPTPSIYEKPGDYGTRAEGTPRQALLEQRQGASDYSTVPGALATALPLIGFGPVAGAASLGLSSVAERANLPGPAGDIAQLAPYFLGEGNLATGAARAVGAGTGLYAGNKLDTAVGAPSLPLVGGPFGLAGMTLGGFTPEIARTGAPAEVGTLPRTDTFTQRLADTALPSMGRFAPEAAGPAAQRVADMAERLPTIGGGASQQEPIASILARADAGDAKVTGAYLRSVASDRGIDLGAATSKRDVIEALRGAETPVGGGARSPLSEVTSSASDATPLPTSVIGDNAAINAATENAPLSPTPEAFNDFTAQNVPNPGTLPVNDPEKYQISQVYSLSDEPNPPANSIELNEVKTRLYNAGMDANGVKADVIARYNEATERGIKLPYEEAPSGMPDARDLALAGRTPQSPLNANPAYDAANGEIMRNGRLSSASNRMDQLLGRAPDPSQYRDVVGMSNDEIISTAKQLGVPIDEDLITRGLPVGRDQELAKVQQALDAGAENALGNMGRAERDYFMSLREERAGLTPEGVQPGWLGTQNGIDSQAQRVIGGVDDVSRMPAGARFGQPNAAGAARAQSLVGKVWNAIRDAAYVPFSGDVGTALRQDASQTLNAFNIKQTAEVTAYTARAGASRDGAETVMDELMSKMAAIDEHAGTKINLHLADVQGVTGGGDSVINKETMQSAGLGKIPGLGAPFNATNRMNAVELNSRRVLELERFVKNHPNEPAAAIQTAANMYERLTGRGSLGGGKVEDALSKAGPLFTSMRFALSIPERAPYLLPWTKLADGSMEIGGPIWREAVKEHAGFVATTGGLMALAGQAGADVNWANGKITVGNTDIDLWGGASQYFTMVRDAVEGEKNGLPYPSLLEKGTDGQYRGTVAEFVRNKMGPVPGAIIQGAQIGGLDKKLGVTSEMQFLRPDYWDKGMFGIAGTKGDVIDKAASFVVPLWIQDVVDAVKLANKTGTDPVNAALLTGALSFLGAGVQSYGGRGERERAQQRNEIAIKGNPEEVFGPDLAKVIPPGTRYSELGSREKELVNAKMDPADLKAQRERAIKEGNQGELAQQQREDLKASYRPSFDKLEAKLKDGSMTPYEVRAATTALEQHMYNAVDQIKFPEKGPGGTFTPSPIQQAESGYRQLYDKAPKTADGKTDYKALEDLRLSYLGAVSKANGADFAGRLAFNVLPRVGPNDSPIQQFYDQPEMKKAVAEYNADGVNKTAYRAENPTNNALLYAGGYVRSLDTPAAVEAYKRYSNGSPEINFTVGFKQDGFQSYAKLEAGSMGKQVKEYEALPSGGEDFERADYLRSHPDVNALLWATAHTSHVYSMNAYQKVAPK